nr:retrovirus-related Pol polyprotein from transposon TNT 1-94 [Tanacetum cinerariifolium]
MEPKKVIQALKDPTWIEAMQEELLQFKLQDVWTLVDLPYEKRAIGSKWVFKNNLDKRGIIIKNKARLVAQGHTQEEGIDYDEVFAPVARIEAIRLFLAYASFKDFIVYQMVMKSAFLYRKIKEEVYVCQPPGFEDPDFPDKVCKVKKALYGLHQALRACQDKYVAEILKKFRFSKVKTASTPMETSKPLLKDKDGQEVDVHMYRSMIGFLMYLTSLRPDIMFTVCACARHQKPTECDGFNQIIYFLNGSSVKYTLTVRPTIHTSCIKQFWTTVKVKKVNDEVRIQALVDGKRVNIKESSIRHTLRLDDAESTSCLTNAEIFEGLESEVIDIKSTYQGRIEKLESKVERLEEENRVLKELMGVHSKVYSDEPVMEKEESSKQGRK